MIGGDWWGTLLSAGATNKITEIASKSTNIPFKFVGLQYRVSALAPFESIAAADRDRHSLRRSITTDEAHCAGIVDGNRLEDRFCHCTWRIDIVTFE